MSISVISQNTRSMTLKLWDLEEAHIPISTNLPFKPRYIFLYADVGEQDLDGGSGAAQLDSGEDGIRQFVSQLLSGGEGALEGQGDADGVETEEDEILGFHSGKT